MKPSLFVFAALYCLCPWSWAEPDAALPSYHPKLFSLPKDTRYVQSDGTVRIYGAVKLKSVVERLNAGFLKSQTTVKFTTERMKGSSVGIPGLTYDVTPFAPMDRAYAEWEMTGYEKIVGEPPLELAAASFGKQFPQAPILYFYVRKTANFAVNDFIKEYFRFVFSYQGQKIVESCGFKPLNATAAVREMAKLTKGEK